MSTVQSESLPSRAVLELRLAKQRKIVFRAQGIVNCVGGMLESEGSPIDGNVGPNSIESGQQALEAVNVMLDELAGVLDPDVMLDAATPDETRDLEQEEQS